MQPAWFDSHCHFDFSALDKARDADWRLARLMGLRGLMIPGVSRVQGEAVARFTHAGQGPDVTHGINAALGLHPYWIAEHSAGDLVWLDSCLSQKQAVAVGETGLDRQLERHGGPTLEQQWQWLSPQIELAETHKLPLVLHIRGAHDEVAAELRRRRFSHGGLVHAFSGSLQQGERWADLGFALGAGGAMTHPNAHKLRRTFAELPLEALLLETDAPDMPPAFLREGPNSPAMIPLYGAILGRVRKVRSLADLAHQLQQNLYRIFPTVTMNSSDNLL